MGDQGSQSLGDEFAACRRRYKDQLLVPRSKKQPADLCASFTALRSATRAAGPSLGGCRHFTGQQAGDFGKKTEPEQSMSQVLPNATVAESSERRHWAREEKADTV